MVKRSVIAALVIAVIGVLVFFLMSSVLAPRQGYIKEYYIHEKDITIIVESSKAVYAPGEIIPIKVSAWNRRDEHFVFSTEGNPVRDVNGGQVISTPLGLSEPRPVYDLVIAEEKLGQPKRFWVWSQNVGDSIPSEITLQGYERIVLVQTLWEPDEDFDLVDVWIRFADVEFPGGLFARRRR